jgi:hypothetical protein
MSSRLHCLNHVRFYTEIVEIVLFFLFISFKKCTIGLPVRYLGCSAAAAARSVVLNRPCSGQRERERASCNFKYLQRGGWGGREGLAIELDPSFRKLKSRSGNTWDPPYLYVYILFTTLLYVCSCKCLFVL